MWVGILIVAAAGALGGVTNAFLTDNGFVLPRRERNDGGDILRPGVLGNMLVGIVAAIVSWGLYGPLANQSVYPARTLPADVAPVTLAAIAGAVLIGVGGSRWLTNEVDKRLLRAAASNAAAAPKASDQTMSRIALARPAKALEMAVAMREGRAEE